MPDLSWPMVALAAATAVVAGTIGGVVGFGSAVVLLPLAHALFGPREAVPILTIAALIGNLSRALASFRDIEWRLVGLYLAGAVPGAFAGARLFVRLEGPWLSALFGVFILASVPARRWAARRTISVEARHLPVLGAAMGLVSAVVSTTGPINAPFFLSLGLVKGAYLATEAVGAAGVHLTKALVYGRFELVGPRQLVGGALVGACLMAGSFVGRRIVDRLSPTRFVQVVEVLLVVSGVALLVESLKPASGP